MKLSSYLVFACFTSFEIGTSISQELEPENGRRVLESSYFFYQQSEIPRDCLEVMSRCSEPTPGSVYLIKPDGIDTPFDVYCDQDWTLLQRRRSGYTDFNRTWEEFKKGFGFLNGEFWLGNDRMAFITNQKNYQLRFDLETSNGSTFSMTYDMFRVGDEWGGYKLLNMGRYNGTANFQRCPANKIVAKCSCEATCARQDVCQRECTEEDRCVCPEGFLLQGEDCVSLEECGCFDQEIGVVPEGTITSNSHCSKRCSCEANQLTCDSSYQCDENAICEERNNTIGCYCRPGYQGDGVTCTAVSYSDCYDVYLSGSQSDGVYTIHPSGSESAFQVYCDMSNGGGWTVFQRRQDGSVEFYRNWASYKNGFGTPSTEFWLGNEKLYHLTNQKNYTMRIDFENSAGESFNMNYESFRIGSEADEYNLHTLGTFSGNTGYDYMAYHRGRAFSTHDNDNDAYSNNCASYYRGAWWYNYCYYSNLNGDYSSTSYTGVALYNYDTNTYTYSLRFTEMKIRTV